MNLGAMIDLGVDRDHLIGELEKLGLKGWKLEISSDQRHGITGTKVTVKTKHEHALRIGLAPACLRRVRPPLASASGGQQRRGRG